MGDRFVAEELERKGWRAGGEPCGHIIFFDHLASGDGLIAALGVTSYLAKTHQKASHVFPLFTPLPQVTQNIPIAHSGILDQPEIQELLQKFRERLEPSGRLVVRLSGTEPVLRIMVEGEDPEAVQAITHEIASRVSQEASLVA